jgi:hypothetical protein
MKHLIWLLSLHLLRNYISSSGIGEEGTLFPQLYVGPTFIIIRFSRVIVHFYERKARPVCEVLFTRTKTKRNAAGACAICARGKWTRASTYDPKDQVLPEGAV